ncbi:MAG: NAD-dependent epimerase/dehydratase family protein, partial [Candidatus Hodarchaeota archaeon]
LRYFNVFGPRQPDNQYSGVISHSMLKIIKNEPLIIFGDGLQTRDFIYVNDVVNANLLTAENKFAIGQIFNVGSGTGISIIDLTKEIIKLFNSKIKYKFSRPRFGDIKDSLADIAKIKKILGFKPKILLQEGLKKIYEWFKKEKRY